MVSIAGSWPKDLQSNPLFCRLQQEPKYLWGSIQDFTVNQSSTLYQSQFTQCRPPSPSATNKKSGLDVFFDS